MEKMIKPAEYAKELGISRQAVYAKIKRGILTAKNIDGKLYIIVDTDTEEKLNPIENNRDKEESIYQKQNTNIHQSSKKDYKALLLAKDETITVLKETVGDLKESNRQISTTLRGEIDLLKEAFHEMRNLYALQLEYKNQETIEIISNDKDSVEIIEEQWISVKKFLKNLGVNKNKHQEKILKQLKKDYKDGKDYIKKQDGKFKINLSKNYEGILK